MTIVKGQKIGWIANLRVVSLLAVIILHASAVLLAQYGKVPLGDWLTADVFNAIVRFAVPVFVMVTGALNLNRDYELGEFLSKRLVRIITPFIFWSLVYIGYSWYIGVINFDSDLLTNIRQILHQLKVGSSYHLWYVYMLIGLYLFMPVVNKFIRAASEKEIIYFLIIWFCVLTISQPYLLRYKPAVDLRYFEGYLGYLVLGYYLATKEFNFKYLPQLTLLIYVIMVVVITVGTYQLKLDHYAIDSVFFEPLGPFAIILSSGIFLFFRLRKNLSSTFLDRVRDFVGKYAYGAYLGHALFLYLLDLWFGITYKFCSPVISIPVTAVLCLVLSVSLTWILNKIPVVGKYIGG